MREAEVAGQVGPPRQRAEYRVQLVWGEVTDHDLQAGQAPHRAPQQLRVDVVQLDISQGKLSEVRPGGHRGEKETHLNISYQCAVVERERLQGVEGLGHQVNVGFRKVLINQVEALDDVTRDDVLEEEVDLVHRKTGFPQLDVPDGGQSRHKGLRLDL